MLSHAQHIHQKFPIEMLPGAHNIVAAWIAACTIRKPMCSYWLWTDDKFLRSSWSNPKGDVCWAIMHWTVLLSSNVGTVVVIIDVTMETSHTIQDKRSWLRWETSRSYLFTELLPKILKSCKIYYTYCRSHNLTAPFGILFGEHLKW